MRDRSNRAPRRVRYGKKKDTVHWCRGRKGVPHQPQVVKVPWSRSMDLKCQPIINEPGAQVGWRHCWHQIECAVCGKFIKDVDPADCPDLKDDDAGEREQR